MPKSDPDAIYVGINERDKAWHDLYKVKISTGERTLISENTDRYQGLVFDNNDKLRLAVRSAAERRHRDPARWRRRQGYEDLLLQCLRNLRAACVSTRTTSASTSRPTRRRDLIELELLDVATGKTEKVESDPLGKVDLDNVNFSDVTHELIATTYEDDRVRIYWKDKAYENDYNLIKKKLGDREISFNSSTADESKFIVSTYSDVDPGTVWLFDRKTKNLARYIRCVKSLTARHCRR